MAGVWTQHFVEEEGRSFWYNVKTGVSTWQHPSSIEGSAAPGPAGAVQTAGGETKHQSSIGEELTAKAAAAAAAAAESAASKLRAQLAAKRKAGGARIKMGELKGGGGKREEQGEAGAGDLQAQYRGSVKELAALNPSSAHGTGGRGLVK